MLVDFMIIGAMKSATTHLSEALSTHPEICFSAPKETNFFCDVNWRDNMEHYKHFFKKQATLYGEGSTNYTKYPTYNKNLHNDLYEYNPKLKFIYIVRHPLDRIRSHYIHAYKRGYETKEINKAIKENPHYILVTQYASQIQPYINRFGKEQIKIIFFDDYIKNPQQFFNQVCDFLDISSIRLNLSLLNKNSSKQKNIRHKKFDNTKTLTDKVLKGLNIIKSQFSKAQLDKEIQFNIATRNYILESLQSEIEAIEHLCHRDLSHWKS